MSTYILWDIDGTLIYNTPTAGALYLDAIEHVTGVRPTVPVENPHGMTEGQLLSAILEVNGLDVGRLGDVLYDLDVLSREQHERGHARDACVGVDAALEAVAERGWTNALLTGNGPNRARYKLLSAGIDPALFDWEHSYFGDHSPTRHHLTAGARSALRTHQAFIIGDTPNDGLAADSAGIPFVAVATGIYTAEQLQATSAIAVIDDLESGIDEALQAVGATLPETPAEAAAAGDAAPDEVSAEAPEGDPAEPVADEEFGESPDVEVSVNDAPEFEAPVFDAADAPNSERTDSETTDTDTETADTDLPGTEASDQDPATPEASTENPAEPAGGFGADRSDSESDGDTDVDTDAESGIEAEFAADFGGNPETDAPGDEPDDGAPAEELGDDDENASRQA